MLTLFYPRCTVMVCCFVQDVADGAFAMGVQLPLHDGNASALADCQSLRQPSFASPSHVWLPTFQLNACSL